MVYLWKGEAGTKKQGGNDKMVKDSGIGYKKLYNHAGKKSNLYVYACIKFDTTYMVRQELMIADSLKGMDGNVKITLSTLFQYRQGESRLKEDELHNLYFR